MKYTRPNHYLTGIAVPVSALRTAESCGIGEFLDLERLGDWCRSIGMELIQILPVNDTGETSSPYSALSAFALNPIYIRLQTLPGAEEFLDSIETLRIRFDSSPRVQYYQVLNEKKKILRALFEKHKTAIVSDPLFLSWIEENLWIVPYASYSLLKSMHKQASWMDFSSYKNPTDEEIEAFWNIHEDTRFYAWIQYHLELQLRRAAAYLAAEGIALKGDLPILMNEDSADVWQHREFFNLDKRAGAPPDMFSDLGQNWGFPIYEWDTLEKNDYSFWKQRLRQADKFYHAYRIDHVLGFFRIWSIEEKHVSGNLGYFTPDFPITRTELSQAGFDAGRIAWLSKPHISLGELYESLKEEAEPIIATCFDRIGNEELFLFKPAIQGERDILNLQCNHEKKEALLYWFRNRTLLEVEKDQFYLTWNSRTTKAYKSLFQEEKEKLEMLYRKHSAKALKSWEAQGRKLLSFMQKETDMLMCAEDLGAVPPCVPKVLKELQIFSLKISRWTRDYSKEQAPYIPLKKYPLLSVCTLSVHDTSTMRGWWSEEKDIQNFWKSLGFRDPCPNTYTPEVAQKVIGKTLETSSALCIFQIQEIFAMDGSLCAPEPNEERINVPGTLSDANWSYRLPISIESLFEKKEFNAKLKDMIEKRGRNQLPQF